MAWAESVAARLGPALADVAAVLGLEGTVWSGGSQKSDRADELESPWHGARTIRSYGGEIHLHISLDYASFDNNNKPRPDKFVVEVAVVFGMEKYGHLPAAFERVNRAWTTFSNRRACVAEPMPYPNPVEATTASIVTFDLETIDDMEPRGLWAAVRSAPFALDNAADIEARTAEAITSISPLLPDWTAAVHGVRGAMLGRGPGVDLQTVFGWCGEVAFHRMEAGKRGMRWGPTWEAPYDFCDENGRFIEVKSSAGNPDAVLHFSAPELKFAREHGLNYTLVHVVVDLDVAKQVLAVLATPRPQARTADRGDPEAHRLALACGVSASDIAALWPKVLPLIKDLGTQRIQNELADPFGWLGDSGAQLVRRHAALSVPVSSAFRR